MSMMVQSGRFGPTPTSNDLMTSNTTPAGNTVTYSSQYDAINYPAWKAFDGVGIGSYGWITSTTTNTGWLRRQWSIARTFLSYTILCSSTVSPYNSRLPKDWTIKGSNDGTNWTTIDTRTGYTYVSDETKTFTIASPGSYTYYEINVTATDGGGYVQIGELDYKFT